MRTHGHMHACTYAHGYMHIRACVRLSACSHTCMYAHGGGQGVDGILYSKDIPKDMWRQIKKDYTTPQYVSYCDHILVIMTYSSIITY